MDREMELQHLAEAERHIAQGERHIAEQEARIAELDRNGHDTKWPICEVALRPPEVRSSRQSGPELLDVSLRILTPMPT